MLKKKGVIAGIATLAMCMSIGSTAFANVDIHGGVEEFNNTSVKKVIEGEVGGGWWIRGIGKFNVESKYKNYSKQGRASTINRVGNEKIGHWMNAGYFSNGSQSLGFGTQTARAYYSIR